MKFLKCMISLLTNKQQYKFFSDYMVNDKGQVIFIVTPVCRFMPEAIPLEELVDRPEIVKNLEPVSAKYFADSFAYVKKLLLERSQSQ
jgi:hypothetical protein